MPTLRCATAFYLRWAIVLLGACTLTIANAHAQPAIANISGAWRLDDQHSDTADTLTMRLRAEARREEPASLPASTHATLPSANEKGNPGLHAAGMGRGGMGGGGMGGGHGGHRHSGTAASDKQPGTNEDPLADARFALPPLLQVDSVLMVQEHAKSVQIQLDNGEQLDVKLDGQAQQSLNGDAMVQGRAYANGMRITIRYADGRRLQENWIRSPDGKQLTIQSLWKLPSLQQPVQFQRSYLAVG